MEEMRYGLRKRVALPFEAALEQVRAALKAEGFGVLTEIDVKATMQEKLEAEFEPYVILGACNPPLAHRALGIEREVGLLLPCNVVVRAGDGETIVEAIDPNIMVELVENADIRAVASEAGERLARALEALPE